MKKLIAIVLLFTMLTSCMSSKYYRGCDGKKKWKSQMNY